MKATVLIDNISDSKLTKEWGLSIYIEYHGKKILLDTGASGRFIENAEELGIDISAVDFAVLSHAHYDHSDGMAAFFEHNDKADFLIRRGSQENCYGKKFIFSRYIGVKKGMLNEYKDRIVYVDGDYEAAPGVTLVPHKTEGLEQIGKKNSMYIKKDGCWYPDDFSHEQSLVIDTEKGLVIFNSCSHGGADNIIQEVASTYPDKKIYAIAGGFHLYKASEAEVCALAERIKATGIEKVYTGHCTGEKAYKLLKERLGEKAGQLKTGLVIDFTS